MAKLPKIYFDGKRVLNLKFNGEDAFESNYKDGVKDIVKCYHKHKGIAGQTSANGCYTVKELYGGSCPGHYWQTVQWYCGTCGRTAPGSSGCSNSECVSNGSPNWAKTIASGTKYCSSASQCSNWQWQTRYILGCGYDVD